MNNTTERLRQKIHAISVFSKLWANKIKHDFFENGTFIYAPDKETLMFTVGLATFNGVEIYPSSVKLEIMSTDTLYITEQALLGIISDLKANKLLGVSVKQYVKDFLKNI